ncbi:tetratricopeptide repeat protein [Mycobacterium sp. KBS0706]|uniref:tetratricopeptide repeat protein n=1 Tax=Mycobacterium sp. KBS0706 TaxID=2578109 RepID=UPI00110F7431|nr:tetratricopeptide repeat protein [Mycobacterium sp. KBS0706]TSD86822.1 tetratricopeptide repeat protein [Mycobacterium sp. KBS0706]
MRRILALLLMMLLFVLAGPAVAQDRAAQLDALFAQLKIAAPEEEPGLQIQIWQLWFAYDGKNADVPGLMERGNTAMATDDYAVAEAAFTAVIENDPAYAEGWNRRATVRYLRGNIQGSIADIDQVLAREPRHFGALSGLGLCRIKLGDTKGAIEAYQRVLAIDPQMATAHAQIEQLKKLQAGDPI